MAKLTSEQRKVVRRIKQIGAEVGASPKEVKAALETGIVESNLRNLPGGDADSAGWRQERASLYPDPTNLDASVRRFFKETSAVKGSYGRAGDLAAAVQRPAAQYRGRYQGVSAQAQALMGGGVPLAPRQSSKTVTTSTPGTDNSAARGALVSQFLGRKGGDVLDFALGIRGLQDTPGTTSTRTTESTSESSAPGGSVDKFTSRANAIDRKKLPYLWGGGHAGKVDPYNAKPLDCSGAVSAVLGINPRVSGDLAKWGKAGRGKRVTIYANAEHVLLEVDGKFWGTSKANPGGGAGWIPRSQISPAYLSRFTARHPPGE